MLQCSKCKGFFSSESGFHIVGDVVCKKCNPPKEQPTECKDCIGYDLPPSKSDCGMCIGGTHYCSAEDIAPLDGQKKKEWCECRKCGVRFESEGFVTFCMICETSEARRENPQWHGASSAQQSPKEQPAEQEIDGAFTCEECYWNQLSSACEPCESCVDVNHFTPNIKWEGPTGGTHYQLMPIRCSGCELIKITDYYCSQCREDGKQQQTPHAIRVEFDQAVSKLLNKMLAAKQHEIDRLNAVDIQNGMLEKNIKEVNDWCTESEKQNRILTEENHQLEKKIDTFVSPTFEPIDYKEAENYFSNTPSCYDCSHAPKAGGFSAHCFGCDEGKGHFESDFKPL